MTESQARVVLSDIARETEAGLPGRTLQPDGGRASSCELTPFPEPQHRFSARWSVEPTPADAEIEAMFDELIATMPARGWEVTLDERRRVAAQVSFQRRADGFSVSYLHVADGRLIVMPSSPCVDPDPAT